MSPSNSATAPSRQTSAQGEIKSPPHSPWTLPARGLALFHGDHDAARLSHYFFPRLLREGKRILMLDGANCADPRLLERLARQRRVSFEQFCRQIQIARAFTCFQLTELIARLPRFLADFPAQVVIVTAFPELYYDEDTRDWNAQVAFEQALANLQRLAGSGDVTRTGMPGDCTGSPWRAPTVAVFSSASTFTPSPARRRFFEKLCAAGSEVWQFMQNPEGKLGLRVQEAPAGTRLFHDPLTRPATADESAVAVHPLPQGGEGLRYQDNCRYQSTIDNRQSGGALWVERYQRFGI